MPSVVMCGLPSSGKTTQAERLKTFLESEYGIHVTIISDNFENSNKNLIYADSRKEKEVRAGLKSALQRVLNNKDVVILDSLNYIKGFRYELYCILKSVHTTQAVVHCATRASIAAEWNEGRLEDNKYQSDVFEALVSRFEEPDARNRWDVPLFTVTPDDTLPCQQIYDALFKSKAPPPNQSTQSLPLSSTNFLHELDKMTQSAVNVIMASQKTLVPGDKIVVPPATETLDFRRHLTLAELQRSRRQFISVVKTRPVEDLTKLANMFVQYLDTSLR